MTPTEPGLEQVLEQLQVLFLFLERQAVQQQVITFGLVVLFAWGVTDGLWRMAGERLASAVSMRLSEWAKRYWHHITVTLRYLLFPLVGLLVLTMVNNAFALRQWPLGILSEATILLWFILIYRIFVLLVYEILGEDFIRKYRNRLLIPLFVLIVGQQIGDNLLDLSVLSDFPLLDWFDNPVTVGEVSGSILLIYFFINTAWAIKEILHDFIAPRTTIDPNAIEAALTLGGYIVMSGGVLLVLAILDVDLSTIAFISGGLSVGLGFGLQQIFSNFISGILLLFEQSLRPGDVVVVDGTMGVVDQLSIRATTIRTFDNVELIVPNETLLSSTVISYTKSSRTVRVVMLFRVSYKSDPRTVLDILLNVAHNHNLVREDPAPAVFFQEIAESNLNFRLQVWIDDPAYLLQVPSELRLIIWDEFESHGIIVPYPQRDLHIRDMISWSGDPPLNVEPLPSDEKTVENSIDDEFRKD